MVPREILFRGLSIQGNKWIYGDVYQPNKLDPLRNRFGEVWIHCHETANKIQVRPETVGEYIGMEDKHDSKIFEGDRVQCFFGNVGKHECTEVVMDIRNVCYYWAFGTGKFDRKVIGNIHEEEKDAKIST